MSKIVLMLVLLFSFYSKNDKVTSQEHEKSFINMERTGCHGQCPIYKITVYGTGKAEYEGKMFVTKLGKFQKQLTKKELNALFSAFEKASFFDFKDEYNGPMADLPTTYITYQDKHKVKKTIKDCWQAPQELKNLEKLVEEVADSQGWEVVDK